MFLIQTVPDFGAGYGIVDCTEAVDDGQAFAALTVADYVAFGVAGGDV